MRSSLFLVFFLVLAVPTSAQRFARPVQWEGREPNLQGLSPEQRDRALRNLREFKKLPADRKKEIERQYRRWQKLSEKEKARVRRRYDELQNMSPEERQDLQERYEQWRRLPSGKKKLYRREFRR